MSITLSITIFLLGIIASIINVLAGGGSNLILPVLILAGLDPQIANATNRVGIWFQNLAGISGFAKKGKLPTQDLLNLLIPTVIGGILGALLAAKLDSIIHIIAPHSTLSNGQIVKTVLLLTMLTVAALIYFKPSTVTYHTGDALPLKHSKVAWGWLLLSGIYGGFVQAGVGFVLVTALACCLHYDLVRANALKLACTMIFTTIALTIFIWQGQVLWKVGFILAAGNAIGALIGVKLAININPNLMRHLLFLMTLVAVVAALFF